MYSVILLNLKYDKRFEKQFDSLYLMNKFINKCRYSNKIKVIGVVRYG